ncbi:DUF21 domain-containing protein [Candidatus Auribacterota bacterium]
MTLLIWTGIFICLSQSAMFSGLTIGFFGLSRLRLEVETATRDLKALRILRLRKDSNFLLSTLLWGNVSANVLLTLLTDSVLTGVGAFLFSTFFITIFGEIMPQAYLSRYALRIGAFLVPIVRFYQIILYPAAKPTALVLDALLGKEGIDYFEEDELKMLIKKHVQSESSEISRLEGMGAVNFLAFDDMKISEEGEHVDPESIVDLPESAGLPVFPEFRKSYDDPFLQRIHASEKKWVIITTTGKEPIMVLDADGFLRHAMYEKDLPSPYKYCHRPIIVKYPDMKIGNVIRQLQVHTTHAEDDVIDNDLILYWCDEKKVITGADILGRLLRGLVTLVDNNKM